MSAYAWFILVEGGGGALSEAAAENRELLTDYMTPEQIADARARADRV